MGNAEYMGTQFYKYGGWGEWDQKRLLYLWPYFVGVVRQNLHQMLILMLSPSYGVQVWSP